MTIEQKKIKIAGFIEIIEKEAEKMEGYKRELANDTTSLEAVDDMFDNGELLPPDCGYDTFIHWRENLEKEVNDGYKKIQKIKDQALEIECYKFYLDTIA